MKTLKRQRVRAPRPVTRHSARQHAQGYCAASRCSPRQACLHGADRYGDYDARRRLLAYRRNRRTHGGAGRQTVIDQYHPLPGQGWRGTIAPTGQVTALQFQAFLLHDRFDGRWGDVQVTSSFITRTPPLAMAPIASSL